MRRQIVPDTRFLARLARASGRAPRDGNDQKWDPNKRHLAEHAIRQSKAFSVKNRRPSVGCGRRIPGQAARASASTRRACDSVTVKGFPINHHMLTGFQRSFRQRKWVSLGVGIDQVDGKYR